MDYLLIFISSVGSLSFILLVLFAIKNWPLIQRDEPIPLLKGLGIYSLLILLAAILAIAPLTYPELPSIIKQLFGNAPERGEPINAGSIVGKYIYKSEPIRYEGATQPLLIGEDGETYYQFIGTVEITKTDKGVIGVCGYRQFAITLDSSSNLKIIEAGVTWTVPPEKIYSPQASENQVIFFLETKPGLTSPHSDRNLAIYLGAIDKYSISGTMYYLNDRKYKSGEDAQSNELLANPTWTRAKMELKKVENFGGNYSYFINGNDAFIDWLSKDEIKKWFKEFKSDSSINDLSALDSLKRKTTERPKFNKCNSF